MLGHEECEGIEASINNTKWMQMVVFIYLFAYMQIYVTIIKSGHEFEIEWEKWGDMRKDRERK